MSKVFKFFLMEYPELRHYKPGDKFKASFEISKVDGDEILMITDGLSYEKSDSRENPGEVMKEIARLQGLINTPQG